MRDGNGGNHLETENLKIPSPQSIQIESDENKGSETQGESHFGNTEPIDTYELGEAENELLFSSPKGRMENIKSGTEEQDLQQQKMELLPEAGTSIS